MWIGQNFKDKDESHIANKQEGRVFENGKFFNKFNAGACHKAEGEDAYKNPGANDPKFGAHCDGGNDVVDT